MPPMPPITQALLLINVAAFCVDLFLGPWFTQLFALWPLGHGFLPWQVVSYAFLHGSIGHLFFNMLGLWMFGAELERVWGARRFIQFYTASVLAAAQMSPMQLSFMGESRRLDNRRMKRELKLRLRYPTVARSEEHTSELQSL